MKRVLVADVDPAFVAAVSTVLGAAGWEVTPALDSMQVMMFATRTPRPEVILLDIDMPGGTGIAALQRLKTSALTSTIPIIVISATRDAAMEERVRGLGARGFIRKPVEPARLDGQLREMLGLPAE